jgi:hypothetical protein
MSDKKQKAEEIVQLVREKQELEKNEKSKK